MIIAGTGHRPNKLGGYGNDVFESLIQLATLALEKYEPARVISGMALGWDQALAQAAINLSVPFDAYVPFTGMDAKWPTSSQQYYLSLLCNAREVVECSPPGYSAYKMQVRNERMVDDCDLLLALWDGSTGGTANCLKYAVTQQRPVKNLWDAWTAMTTA